MLETDSGNIAMHCTCTLLYIYIYIYIYILLHEQEGNIGKYSAQELNIFHFCPTIVSAIIDILYDFYI